MIFTSQSGLLDPGGAAAWDEWYIGHLRAMAAVPGILSAQRFALLAAEPDPRRGSAAAPDPSPSLAMYTVTSPAVFESETYLRTRGMGPWQDRIDRRWYHRNLFDGIDAAPEVAADAILLVLDRDDRPAAEQAGVTWLRAVEIDRSTPYRGIAVLADVAAARVAAAAIPGPAAFYRPVSERFSGSG